MTLIKVSPDRLRVLGESFSSGLRLIDTTAGQLRTARVSEGAFPGSLGQHHTQAVSGTLDALQGIGEEFRFLAGSLANSADLFQATDSSIAHTMGQKQ